jgi:benzaldehyde dehydrogenase (NAD)
MTSTTLLTPTHVWNEKIYSNGWKHPGLGTEDVAAARLVLAYADELTEQLIRETGSIRAKAQWEVHVTARELLEAAALGSQPQGILTQTMEAGFQSIARRIPLGVIGIITPWNSPFILGVRAIGPALAMGNAVLLKPDVQSPIIGGVDFARVLEEAGLPKGLFHVLPGAAQTGAALVREPLIKYGQLHGFQPRRPRGWFGRRRTA